jgi:hypothetical protein
MCMRVYVYFMEYFYFNKEFVLIKLKIQIKYLVFRNILIEFNFKLYFKMGFRMGIRKNTNNKLNIKHRKRRIRKVYLKT